MNDFFVTFIQPGLICGLCYGIAAIGVSVPLRFLGTADFTAIGAIMLGGIVTVWATNTAHWILGGLLCGSIVAGLLGVLTAWLSLNLNIALMLSGIISFTASESLGLLIAKNGNIELTHIAFMNQKFTWSDAILVMGIALTVCIVCGVLARSKLGCFAFAMCASSRLVKYRHRNSRQTTYCLLFFSNLLIGLCGGLLAIKTRSAFVEIHAEFLALTLGAIYAGQAGVQLVARFLKQNVPAEIPLETQVEKPEGHRGILETLRLSFSTQRDDSERMHFIFSSYILASVLLNCVTQSVRGQVFFHVPPAFEYVIVALIITLGLFVSSLKSKSAPKSK